LPPKAGKTRRAKAKAKERCNNERARVKEKVEEEK